MEVKELFKKHYGEPEDKFDRVAKKYDYYDMLDFALAFYGEQLKNLEDHK